MQFKFLQQKNILCLWFLAIVIFTQKEFQNIDYTIIVLKLKYFIVKTCTSFNIPMALMCDRNMIAHTL